MGRDKHCKSGVGGGKEARDSSIRGDWGKKGLCKLGAWGETSSTCWMFGGANGKRQSSLDE